ncbi:MAG: hypothetical protein MHM6MM_002140 [Cercozoa sp. M6MM]
MADDWGEDDGWGEEGGGWDEPAEEVDNDAIDSYVVRVCGNVERDMLNPEVVEMSLMDVMQETERKKAEAEEHGRQLMAAEDPHRKYLDACQSALAARMYIMISRRRKRLRDAASQFNDLTDEQKDEAQKQVLQRLFDECFSKLWQNLADGRKKKRGTKSGSDAGASCAVCLCDFEADESTASAVDDDQLRPIRLSLCACAVTCRECLKGWLNSLCKKEADFLPWPRCPADNCGMPLAPEDMLHLTKDVVKITDLCANIAQQNLLQTGNWIECQNEACEFGFYCTDSKLEEERTCQICDTTQNVKKSPNLDEGLQAMLDKGELRTCPSCELPTFKEYGICNVIQCGRCSIWWNWRTRETGSSSRELKNRARMTGSLWEPGDIRRHSVREMSLSNR